MESPKLYELIAIFQDLLKDINNLYQFLMREADALDTRSPGDLQSIAREKECVITRINLLTQQQNSYLKTINLPEGDNGLRQLLDNKSNGDPQLVEMKTYWIKISKRLAECRHLNEQNGARIELLNCHAQRSLEILKGQSHLPYTYGPTGIKQKDSSNRSTVSV